MFVNKGEQSKQTIRRIGSCVVIIPAHNEESGITDTLNNIKQELGENDRMVVIADNCSDNTASICRELGVEVLERFNKEHVGKGFALQHGVDYVKENYPETQTIVVMDADCLFEKGAFSRIVSKSQALDSVVQGKYLMLSPNQNNIKLNIAEFTWMIKNWVRPVGQKMLGIGCHIQGSGMAFPLRVLKAHSLASSSIVEDLELGLNLTKAKEEVFFFDEPSVYSYFPENEVGLETQRKRWEHGHMAIVLKMPKVILKAIFKLNLPLALKALDAAIPPTVLWLATSILVIIISLVASYWLGFGLFFISSLITLTMLGLLFLIWVKLGTKILPARQLSGALNFVLSKFGVYKSFIKNREKEWKRTNRD
ncbi:glycosyltransferase [Glaciecola sp. KUL10]|uniref:glycosyltransferase family 2 protein n=1 Tax=Glaciecola sp. (strain KUL10) TaxID=2161813 RepID=UPI00131489FD|nr:glycosyltransferase [Glaciecola sp. KUL10]